MRTITIEDRQQLDETVVLKGAHRVGKEYILRDKQGKEGIYICSSVWGYSKNYSASFNFIQAN